MESEDRTFLNCAVAVGRLDGSLAMATAVVRHAALVASYRDLAIAIAAREGAATTALRLSIAVAGVDGEADRSARFAANILDAILFLEETPKPLSAASLREAFDLSERSNTSVSSSLDSDCEFVSTALSRSMSDLGEIEERLDDLSGSRVRRRLVSFALPFVLARYFEVATPIPVFLAPREDEETRATPGAHLAAVIIASGDDLGKKVAGALGLWGHASHVLKGERVGGRAADAYAESLVRPVLVPGDMVRSLGVTARGASKILGRLVGHGLLEQLPANRLARQITLCRPALSLG